MAGQGALGVVALATLARGQVALGPLFPVAVVAWAAGTIAYAVATATATGERYRLRPATPRPERNRAVAAPGDRPGVGR